MDQQETANKPGYLGAGFYSVFMLGVQNEVVQEQVLEMNVFKDFLENSTIHGLVYISTAKSFVAKSLWVIIVALGFGFADDG